MRTCCLPDDPGRKDETDMIRYVPIFKGRAAECWAWRNASRSVIASSHPVFEVLPENDVRKAIGAFVKRIIPQHLPRRVIAVDTGYLDQTQQLAGTTNMAVLHTANTLHSEGVAAKPVMRITDDLSVLQEVKDAADLHGHGACLHLGWPWGTPNVHDAAQHWPRVSSATSLRPTEVDLLIDFGPVHGVNQTVRAAQTALDMLQWANISEPWRSVTVAAGAFTFSISNLSPNVATPIHRYDAELFDRIMAGRPPVSPDYGDYGIVHPRMVASGGNAPWPNLKYTSRSQWQVYREQKSRPPYALFYDICDKVVASGHWPVVGEKYSAGDAQIYRRKLRQDGTGTATHWLRWGSSHHCAHVIDRLSNQGVT